MTDNYDAYFGQELYAGSFCIRYCKESGGMTCNSTTEGQIEYGDDEHNSIYCNSNGDWDSDQECTGGKSFLP